MAREKMTALHRAVIIGDIESVAQLKNSHWHDDREGQGFNALELAQLLGQKRCQELLQPELPRIIRVQFKDQKSPTSLSVIEFEEIFKVIYRPFLTFSSYALIEEVIRNCPYLFRLERLLVGQDLWEKECQAKLALGTVAETFVKWIDSSIGYGLFAATDLPERSFVGEYTGLVRRVDRENPQLNGYCFQYPFQWLSKKYFVIDSFQEGNVLRFINHSRDPNLQPLWLMNRGILHLIFITKKWIPQGAELTYDYGTDYWMHRKELAH